MLRNRHVLSCGIVLLVGMACGPVRAATPSYEYFFTAVNDSYKAYLDLANITTDGAGNKLVSVKITTFSEPFRGWIKKIFPAARPPITPSIPTASTAPLNQSVNTASSGTTTIVFPLPITTLADTWLRPSPTA